MVWPYRMSPAAMNTGSLLSWLVMLSTENWEMLSQLLVCTSGSWESREPWVRSAKHRPHFVTRSSSHFACLPPLHRDRPPPPPPGLCSRKPALLPRHPHHLDPKRLGTHTGLTAMFP